MMNLQAMQFTHTSHQWRGDVFWTGGLKVVRSCQRLGGEALSDRHTDLS